jgi:hypothetical protein
VVFLCAIAAVLAVRAPAPDAQTAESKRITLDRYGVTIDYEVKDEKIADGVASIFEKNIPRVSGELGLSTIHPFRVFLIPDIADYQRKMKLRLPSWGIAFAFMENQIMLVDVKRAANAWNSLDDVIPHELSHLLLAQRVGNVPMPLWFIEGLAQWQAREWSFLDNWRLMEAVWGRRAPGLVQISYALPPDQSRAQDAYRVAYTAFQYRFEKKMEDIPAFLDEVVRHGDFGEAFAVYFDETELEYSWRFARHLNSRYKSGLMLFQTGPLFTLMALLFLLVVLRTWIRNRRKMRELEDVERGLRADD